MRQGFNAGQRHAVIAPAVSILAGLAALGCGLAADYAWAVRLAGFGIAVLAGQVVYVALRRSPRGGAAARPRTGRSGVEPLDVGDWPARGSRPLPEVPPNRLFQPEVLDEILRQAIAAARPSALARGHDLDVRMELHGERVAGDARQLGQVLVTLLADAVRSTEPGGAIIVAARCDGGAAVVSIRNTGTGLGRDLSRVREIAAQHGGRLEVRLADDGAERIVTLPVLARAA
jgi:hypothetical protein